MKKLMSLLALTTLTPLSINLTNFPSIGTKINNLFSASKTKNGINPFLSKQLDGKWTNNGLVAPNGNVYISTNSGGLYYSTNGTDFKNVNGIGLDENITDLIIAPNNTIYAATFKSGLYYSTNGTDFNQVAGNIPKDYIHDVKVTNDGAVYAGTEHGAYFAKDGINFIKIEPIGDNYCNLKLITSKNLIYIQTRQGLYYSKDGVNFSLTSGLDLYVNEISESKNGTVYVSADTPGNANLYYSKDGVSFSKAIGINQHFQVLDIIYSSNGTVYISGLNAGMYISKDGVSFTRISSVPNDKSAKIAIASNGAVYAGTSWDGLYYSTNGTDFNYVNNLGSDDAIQFIGIAPNNTVYVTTLENTYFSTNGINFSLFDNLKNVIKMICGHDNSIYFLGGGLSIYNVTNKLVDMNLPDYYGDKFDGFVYKTEQKINIKNDYLESGTLDNQSISIPAKDLPITVGKHTLTLTIKSEYQKYIDTKIYGDGTVNYNFWVKDKINNLDINFNANKDDTELLTGLISNSGNTVNSAIIQTRAKTGSGKHNATLNFQSNDQLIDFKNSYYIQGTIDSGNNFSASGQKIAISEKSVIDQDGIYYLHLVDFVGNSFDSYLELGEINWSLKGSFNDQELNLLASKLNVSINVTDPTEKQKAMGWLQNYQADIEKQFNSTVKDLGKGFDIKIADFGNEYKNFLNHIDYIDSDTKENINLDKLKHEIIHLAQDKLKNGLAKLPQNLNVDTSNVTNRETLDSYSIWINSYQDFINQNKEKWNQNIADITSRGFATDKEKSQINNYLNSLDFSKYLKRVTWKADSLLNNSLNNDFVNNVELDKLQGDVSAWVNKNIPDISNQYQATLKTAESGLNLHGYTIDQLLNGNKRPETKAEFGNYQNSGQSYHSWLQSQADSAYKGHQFKMGLGIGIPLGILTIGIGIFLYWRFSKKFNPYLKSTKKTN